VKLLRAFAKVALAPGETKTVPLRVAVRDLAWYDAPAKSWRIEPMAYRILVGPSSRASDLLGSRVVVSEAAGAQPSSAAD